MCTTKFYTCPICKQQYFFGHEHMDEKEQQEEKDAWNEHHNEHHHREVELISWDNDR